VEELLLLAVQCTWAGGVRQSEMHTAEPFLPELSALGAEVAVGKPKRHKLPGFDQIPAELIQAGGGNIVF
jgi:hypothetical protein